MRTERANAKINLYLNLTGRRENGYHEIESVMQTVSLCDLVSLEYCPGSHTAIRLEISGGEGIPSDCRNLAYRAAEKFLGKTGRRGGVTIRLEKHIPMAAGLAGGSADAAAVFRGLNRLCGNPLSKEELLALGATLGADIPFCICGGNAKVSGVGEILEKGIQMPETALVVACGNEGVSTPWAYGELDAKFDSFADRTTASERAISGIYAAFCKDSLQNAREYFYNVFEEVVPQSRPEVGKIKSVMVDCGCEYSMMSGSGPSVFGVFASAQRADFACGELKKLGVTAFVCHPAKEYGLD